MGTTTKMAIPYPEATGLVKDGWEDMKDIATQVDAKSGLVLIKTDTFSAVSAVNVNDVFSTNYDFYKVVVSLNPSATTDVLFRYRVSGADNSTSNYRSRLIYMSGSGTVSGSYGGTTTSALFNAPSFDANERYDATIDIYNPFNALTKHMNFHYGVANNRFGIGSSDFAATTSFTGFSLISLAGNFTGNLSVFGVNK